MATWVTINLHDTALDDGTLKQMLRFMKNPEKCISSISSLTTAEVQALQEKSKQYEMVPLAAITDYFLQKMASRADVFQQEIAAAKIQIWEDIHTKLECLRSKVKVLQYNPRGGSNLLFDRITTCTTNIPVPKYANQKALIATITDAHKIKNSTLSTTVESVAKPMMAYGTIQAADYTNPRAGSVTLNGACIAFSGGEKLQDIAKAINAAKYSENQAIVAYTISNRLALKIQSTGISYKIYGSTNSLPPFNPSRDGPDNILSSLGLIDRLGNFVSSIPGQNAFLNIESIPITSSSNTIDAVSGLNIAINPYINEFPLFATVNVDYDTKKIKKAITDLVITYSDTCDYLDSVLKNAKVEPTDKESVFDSDPLLKSIYDGICCAMGQNVTMGTIDWTAVEGMTTTATGTAGDGALTISNLKYRAGNGVLRKGDRFTILGDLNLRCGLPNIYIVTQDVCIGLAGSCMVPIYPNLMKTATNAKINLEVNSLADIGIYFGLQRPGIFNLDILLLKNALKTNMPLVQRLLLRSDPVQLHNDRPYDDAAYIGIIPRLSILLDKYIPLINKS